MFMPGSRDQVWRSFRWTVRRLQCTCYADSMPCGRSSVRTKSYSLRKRCMDLCLGVGVGVVEWVWGGVGVGVLQRQLCCYTSRLH